MTVRRGCPVARHHASAANPATKRAISARVNAPRPASAPSATARHPLGCRSKSSATTNAAATIRTANDSDITNESLIHRFGYTAAIPAANNPIRGPANRSPSNPITNTAAAPTNVMPNRCHGTPSP